jgi:lipid-A-disaccharide synthase
MRIFVSTGEPSGDLHASNLIAALKRRLPDAEFVGFGGPRMEAAGARLLYPLVNLAIMWFLQVFVQIATFIRLILLTDRYFRDERPDVVVLIDYPGLHWWIARRARARGIRVVYYVPPQLWAWGGWRVEKMRRYVDRILCSLPFEPAWYEARGVAHAEYVGHPYFDELADRRLDADFFCVQVSRGRPVVAVLPGSRAQEIIRNVPVLLRAAAAVAAHRPDVRFVVSCLKPAHADRVRDLVAASGLAIPQLEIHHGRTPELIRLADLAWSVSGSVSLELLAEALPTVILYKVNRLDLLIARPFIKSKYITLVNLLAGAELMPEYLTSRDVAPELAGWALRWLTDPEERERAAGALAALRDRVAQPGATDRAADRIVALLTCPAPDYRGPHKAPLGIRDAECGMTRMRHAE